MNVLDRVRKLLARAADSGSSETEVKVAAAEAQRLMQEHKLSEADVTEAVSDGSGIVDLPAGSEGFMASWKFALVTSVARAFFCEAVGLRIGPRRKVRIVGRREDAEVVLSVMSFLTKEIERLAEEFSRLPDELFLIEEVMEGTDKRRRMEAYRSGLASGVASTLKAQAEEFRRRGAREAALVLRSAEAVREHLLGKFGESREGARVAEEIRRMSSFELGVERGRRIKLDGVERAASQGPPVSIAPPIKPPCPCGDEGRPGHPLLGWCDSGPVVTPTWPQCDGTGVKRTKTGYFVTDCPGCPKCNPSPTREP